MLALALLCGGLVSTQGEERPGVAGVDLLAQASAEFERGKFDAALAILDAAEKQDLPKAKILDLRGSIYLEQGKLPEALAAFTAAHAADAAIYAPPLHLADALLRQGKWSEARDAYLALMKATNNLTVNERTRYGVLLANLGSKDDGGAQAALARLPFPTESPAYYYGQAAWSYAHGQKGAGDKWIRTANEIYKPKHTAWFGQPLHDMGWLRTKPPIMTEKL